MNLKEAAQRIGTLLLNQNPLFLMQLKQNENGRNHIRTEQEMMGLLIDFAQQDKRVVSAVLEGSRSAERTIVCYRPFD